MKKVEMYFVLTNARNEVIVDDGEARYIIDNAEVPQGSDIAADEAQAFLDSIEDYSSWDEYGETVDELTNNCDILAYIVRYV